MAKLTDAEINKLFKYPKEREYIKLAQSGKATAEERKKITRFFGDRAPSTVIRQKQAMAKTRAMNKKWRETGVYQGRVPFLGGERVRRAADSVKRKSGESDKEFFKRLYGAMDAAHDRQAAADRTTRRHFETPPHPTVALAHRLNENPAMQRALATDPWNVVSNEDTLNMNMRSLQKLFPDENVDKEFVKNAKIVRDPTTRRIKSINGVEFYFRNGRNWRVGSGPAPDAKAGDWVAMDGKITPAGTPMPTGGGDDGTDNTEGDIRDDEDDGDDGERTPPPTYTADNLPDGVDAESIPDAWKVDGVTVKYDAKGKAVSVEYGGKTYKVGHVNGDPQLQNPDRSTETTASYYGSEDLPWAKKTTDTGTGGTTTTTTGGTTTTTGGTTTTAAPAKRTPFEFKKGQAVGFERGGQKMFGHMTDHFGRRGNKFNMYEVPKLKADASVAETNAWREKIAQLKTKLANNPRALVKTANGDIFQATTGARVERMGPEGWWFVHSPDSDAFNVTVTNALFGTDNTASLYENLSAEQKAQAHTWNLGGHQPVTPEGGGYFNLEAGEGDDAGNWYDTAAAPVTEAATGDPNAWAQRPEGAPDWLLGPQQLGDLSTEDFNAYMQRYNSMIEHGLMPNYYQQMNQPEQQDFNLETASADEILQQMKLLGAKEQYQARYGEDAGERQDFDISTASTGEIEAEIARLKAVQGYEDLLGGGDDENQPVGIGTQGPVTAPGGTAPGDQNPYTVDDPMTQGGYTGTGQSGWQHQGEQNFDPAFAPPTAEPWMDNQNQGGRF